MSSEDGPTEVELREALATIAGVWDQVAETFSTALADPDLRAQMRRAASSLASAIGTTLTELGVELAHVRDEGSDEEE